MKHQCQYWHGREVTGTAMHIQCKSTDTKPYKGWGGKVYWYCSDHMPVTKKPIVIDGVVQYRESAQ